MALYADPCILLPLFFRDPSTEAALAWLEQAGKETIQISPWTRTEFAGAAGIMARRGDISGHLHEEGLERFDRLISAGARSNRSRGGGAEGGVSKRERP